MENIEQYIEENFLNVPLTPHTMYVYAPRKNILNAIKSVVNIFHGKVIDLGCGVMPYKKLFLSNQKVENYLGIDLQLSDYHNKVQPDLFWDGIHIPIDSETVDCVLATEFLEHYAEPDKILKEIFRVLKPGGLVFFTVPFIWNLHEIPYDEYRFTPYSLERHLKDSGFINIDIKGTSGWDSSLATMLAMWLECRVMSRKKRKYLRKIVFYIYKRLMKTDTRPEKFDNWHNSMSQGFSALAYKA